MERVPETAAKELSTDSKTHTVSSDLGEWKRLLTLVNPEVANVKQEIKQKIVLLEEIIARPPPNTAPVPVTPPVPTAANPSNKLVFVSLLNFGWDQTMDQVKLYVSLPNVHLIPESSVSIDFAPSSFDLKVVGLEKKNYRLNSKQLAHEIQPKASTSRVKTNSITITLKKKKSVWWDGINKKESVLPRQRPTEKTEVDNSDPSASMMKLMKDLYDNGDDEMKRTIQKAWVEADDKRRQGGGVGPL